MLNEKVHQLQTLKIYISVVLIMKLHLRESTLYRLHKQKSFYKFIRRQHWDLASTLFQNTAFATVDDDNGVTTKHSLHS